MPAAKMAATERWWQQNFHSNKPGDPLAGESPPLLPHGKSAVPGRHIRQDKKVHAIVPQTRIRRDGRGCGELQGEICGSDTDCKKGRRAALDGHQSGKKYVLQSAAVACAAAYPIGRQAPRLEARGWPLEHSLSRAAKLPSAPCAFEDEGGSRSSGADWQSKGTHGPRRTPRGSCFAEGVAPASSWVLRALSEHKQISRPA